MNITFIKPNMGRMMKGAYVDEGRMEPLQIGILAALTPSEFEISFFDDRMENIDYNQKTDLVAITVETFTAKRAYEIAMRYKERGTPVIMGGMHPTLIPEEALLYADSIVIGDAEDVWKTLLEDFVNNRLKKVYEGSFSVPQKGIFPRRDIFKGKGYLPISLMQFSRGCINGCYFCAASVFFKQKQYCRPVEEVVDEIKTQKLRLIFFVDDNIVADKDKAKALFKALIPLKIKWVSQGSIDMTQDLELMRLMMKSGCMGNVIGFESINSNALEKMNKKKNIGLSFDQYKEQIKILRHFGHQTWAAFTLGHDDDTTESIKEIYRFALKNKFAFAAFNILMPYPNTPLYCRLEQDNRLYFNGKWWLHDDFRFNNAAIMPMCMSGEELTEMAFIYRKKFNSRLSILYRCLDFKTNMRSPFRLMTFFAYNPLFRKEVYKKQDMILGFNEKER
jgi:radical SAM superfamily enzyme YgiQ (UPF0313 family)